MLELANASERYISGVNAGWKHHLHEAFSLCWQYYWAAVLVVLLAVLPGMYAWPGSFQRL
jgi:hypothetical protein